MGKRLRLVQSNADTADGTIANMGDLGHVPTWEEVANDHSDFMYTVAYRLTGKHAEAEDVVQEALVRVQRGLPNYTPGNLRGWLSRITTNVFLDEARRRKRRPVQALPDDPERVLAGAPAADEALDLAGLPDHIQEAIRDLPYDYRAALVMCDVVGLSYAEISESLDIPVGTVRSRISRARQSLRKALAPYLAEQGRRS